MLWGRLSIRAKFTVLTMTTCVLALVLSSAGVIAYARINTKSQLTAQVQSMADLIGTTSIAAIQFQDATAGTEALAAFRSDPLIESASIDLPDGSVFATYAGDPDDEPAPSSFPGLSDLVGSITVRREIHLDGRQIGSIQVQASLRSVQEQISQYMWLLALILGVASVAALILATRLQRLISGPIQQLAHTAKRISTIGDYRVRAEKRSSDELGDLVDQFNEMLSQIETRDAELIEARDQLEARVRERTEKLELEIRERRRTEEELILAKSAAEEASLAKSTFLASMSHELRTPLNAIIGYSELLKEDAEEEGATQYVKDVGQIITAGHHLLSLINAVLDLSKIEAGRMTFDVEAFDLVQFVRRVADLAEPLAAKQNNVLVVSPDEDLGSMRSDQTKVQQVLINLLGNACKFTTDGTITLAVSRSRDLTDDVVFRIADTGIGVSPEQQALLFRDFSQAESPTVRRNEGTGLGLAISQRICRLMHGNISMESAVGVGTTFTVRLPAEHAEETDSKSPSSLPEVSPSALVANSAVDTERPLVLVIDDDANARDLACRAVGKAGFRAVEAATAEDGLQLIKTFPMTAVVLDVILPDVDGWTLLQRLKKMPEAKDVPVIITSVSDDRRRSMSVGAIEHLTKPFDVARLIRILRQPRTSRDSTADAPTLAELVAAPGTSATVQGTTFGKDGQ